MGGLVGYASSDEDDELDLEAEPGETKSVNANVKPNGNSDTVASKALGASETSPASLSPATATSSIHQHDAPLGPSLPSAESAMETEGKEGSPPASPYSASRSLLRDLTLPALPNLDIPPSPPGSPPSATNKKFEQFLDLKKKGIHFNSKLAMSSALRNPSLTNKLMDFVELDSESQYSTTISADIWNPAGFPDWAFRKPLENSQEAIRKEKEVEKASGKRDALDFVPSRSGGVQANKAAGGISRSEKRKATGWP